MICKRCGVDVSEFAGNPDRWPGNHANACLPDTVYRAVDVDALARKHAAPIQAIAEAVGADAGEVSIFETIIAGAIREALGMKDKAVADEV